MSILSHSELVDRGALWLQKKFRCPIVAKELVASTRSHEIPDVLGWFHGTFSILVECKASRSDFLHDSKKPARNTLFPAMGNFRIYLTIPGISKPEELPDGWSLYEVHPKRILYKGGFNMSKCSIPPFLEPCRRSEMAILQSIVRRSVGYKPLIVDSNTYRNLLNEA